MLPRSRWDGKVALSKGKLILKYGGIEHFLKCAKIFPDNNKLKENMLGTFGLIATVKDLRQELLKSEKFVLAILNLGISINHVKCLYAITILTNLIIAVV